MNQTIKKVFVQYLNPLKDTFYIMVFGTVRI